MNKTADVSLSPSAVANLSSLVTRANSKLGMITSGEILRFFETEDVQESINNAFRSASRSGHRTIALEGADKVGKSKLAPAIAEFVGGQVFAASAVSDQLLKQIGIPASEKPKFFLNAESNLVSLTFFLLANAQLLSLSSASQSNETVSVLDGFVFRTLAAHQARRALSTESPSSAEQTLTKLENLMVEKVAGSPSFEFVFLYASPKVRESHLALQGKDNRADKNSNIAQIGSEYLLSYEQLLRSKRVPTHGIYSILKGESCPLRMANANIVFPETNDTNADVAGKVAILGRFLRT